MSSLVLELQSLAMDPQTKVTDLVRRTLVVATKLHQGEMRDWATTELAGYNEKEVPPYRRIEGQVMAQNPVRGLVPVMFESGADAKRLATRAAVQPLGEIEDTYREKNKKGLLVMPFSQEALNRRFGNNQGYRMGVIPTVVINRQQLFGILDAVRNAVLQWTLTLEAEGIVGAGMTFSQAEVSKAANVTYNIHSFTGVLGAVTQSSVVIGDYSSIHGELKQLGIPQSGRNELESILDEGAAGSPAEKKAAASKGLIWLAKYGPAMGALSDTVRGWFEHWVQ